MDETLAENAEQPSTVVFTLRFGEEGRFYALDRQGDAGGGPLVYEGRDRAEAAANAVGAIVVEQPLEHMILLCQEAGWVLWLKRADGTVVPVAETLRGSARPGGGKPRTRRKGDLH